MKKINSFVVLLCMIVCSCATVEYGLSGRGVPNILNVSAPAGSTVRIFDNKNNLMFETDTMPFNFRLNKGKPPYKIEVSKQDYVTKIYTVEKQVAGAYWINIIAAPLGIGLIGLIVDPLTPYFKVVNPKRISATLELTNEAKQRLAEEEAEKKRIMAIEAAAKRKAEHEAMLSRLGITEEQWLESERQKAAEQRRLAEEQRKREEERRLTREGRIPPAVLQRAKTITGNNNLRVMELTQQYQINPYGYSKDVLYHSREYLYIWQWLEGGFRGSFLPQDFEIQMPYNIDFFVRDIQNRANIKWRIKNISMIYIGTYQMTFTDGSRRDVPVFDILDFANEE